MAIDYDDLANAIVKGDMETAAALTGKGLADGKAEGRDDLVMAKEVLNKGLIGGMDIISELWVQEKIFIPEVLISAKVMHACMDQLRPILEASKEPPRGIMVIGTVKGDLHDIGQNIVGMMLKGNGFEVHNIGPNSSPEKFMNKIRETNANLVGLSALLTGMAGSRIRSLPRSRSSRTGDSRLRYRPRSYPPLGRSSGSAPPARLH